MGALSMIAMVAVAVIAGFYHEQLAGLVAQYSGSEPSKARGRFFRPWSPADAAAWESSGVRILSGLDDLRAVVESRVNVLVAFHKKEHRVHQLLRKAMMETEQWLDEPDMVYIGVCVCVCV
jgi:hypothetical protein